MDKQTAEFIYETCQIAGLEGVSIRDDRADEGLWAIATRDNRETPVLRIMGVLAYEMAYLSRDDEGFDPNEFNLRDLNQQAAGLGSILY